MGETLPNLMKISSLIEASNPNTSHRERMAINRSRRVGDCTAQPQEEPDLYYANALKYKTVGQLCQEEYRRMKEEKMKKQEEQELHLSEVKKNYLLKNELQQLKKITSFGETGTPVVESICDGATTSVYAALILFTIGVILGRYFL